MKNEKTFWAGLLAVSSIFILLLTYFFMRVIFPFHVDQMKKRADETVHHLQTVLPHLSPPVRQQYLEKISKETEDLSYLLLMDVTGRALNHSNPSRIGMSFDEAGFRRCLTSGTRIEQIYIRDADRPDSPYHNEKTIDILDPYYAADGKIAGVVNVGISLAAVESIKQKYITVSVVAVAFWFAFIAVFAFSHLRTLAQKRRADHALLESERRLSRAVSGTSDAIWEWHLTTGATYFSPRWYSMLGYDEQELAMTIDTWQELCHPDDLLPTMARVEAAVATRGAVGYEAEFRLRHKQGHWLWILGRGNFAEFADDHTPTLLSGTNTDITERKNNEEKLRESESRYRSIIENIQDVYYRTDREGILVQLSPSGSRLLGYESTTEMLGRPNAFFWAKPEQRNELLAQLGKTGVINDYEVVLRRKDGSSINVSTSSGYYHDQHGNILGVEGIFRDITERKRAEKSWQELQEQLLQSQKMEAVGRLAGGVAHDFNNMLVVIMGRAELALMKLPVAHPLYVDLLEIRQAAERSAHLTKHLLAFARKQTVSPKVLDLNTTIATMLKMHRRLIGEEIEIEWLPGADLHSVKIDPSQIDQLLVNLCVNARDAIVGVGKVKIATSNVLLDTEFCAQHVGLRSGKYVQLTVSDNGSGIEADIIDHIFEPFFTTKDLGKGTGIGLATVFGIVKQNNGIVTVESRLGQGTTFNIYLPVFADTLEDVEEIVAVPETQRGLGETILLVEDEAAIIDLGKVMLESLNYRVLEASSAAEAILLAKEYAGAIDLLITDVVMPQMNGRELASQIMTICPDVQCLYMSGYTADIIGERGILDDTINFIQKPFSMQMLADKVHQVLNHRVEITRQ